MRRLRLAATLLLFISAASTLSGLEIKNGRIRLILDERTGSFSVGYLADLGGNSYLPLLFPEDPRTSYFSVVLNNRVIKVAESYDFELTTERTSSGARFVWRSKQLEITESFSFVSSDRSGLSDGIAVDLKLKNISSDRIQVGVRYLLDTYLGEDAGRHFVTEFHNPVPGELSFSAPYPGYILSPRGRRDDEGLMIMLKGIGVTRPDSVVLANWKRLDDSGWNFTVNTSRNFSRPPYSINDSAAALYYTPQTLAAGAERSLTLALGYYAVGGFNPGAEAGDEKLGNLVATLSEEQSSSGSGRTPEEELAAVRELIAEIDLLIEAGRDVPEEKLQLLRELLATLQERKRGFED